jgi:hypothetical protein
LKNNSPKKTTAHPVVAFPSSLRARLLDLLNNHSRLEPSLFSEIKKETDAEIVQIRGICEQFDYVAWKMAAACDAQIWDREKAKTGRGNVDTKEIGIMAALAKREKEVGCSSITIRRNANVFFTFEKILINSENTLSEKGFFQVALRAPDPQEAISEFIKRRRKDPTFRVRDAEHWLNEKTESDRKDKDKFGKSREEKQLRLESHFKHAANKIQALMWSCPDKELGKKIYEPMVQDLRDLIEDMFTADATQACIKAWDNGYRRENQIASHTGLPKSTVSHIMKQLENEGEFYKVPQRGETEMARGRHTVLWHRKNHVVGNAYTQPQLVRKYA